MTNAWFHAFTFHAFTASITPADSKRVMRGNGCQYRRAARQRTLWRMFNASLLFAVILVQGNLALAQELDSSVLQKEAEEEAAAKAKQSQRRPMPQVQPPQAANPQDRTQSSQPQASPQPILEPQPQMPPGYPAQPGQPIFMLPPGTKLPLGLLRPLKLKSGQDIYLQITFPVTVGNQMLIPPGTYIQGVVEKIVRKDRRRYRLDFEVRSASMIFLNGYTVPIAGTVNIATTNAVLQAPLPRNSNGQPVAAMAAVGSATTPSLPSDPFAKDVHNAMIVIGVVAAVAVTTAIVLAARSDPYVEVGTPLEIILPAPLFLDAGRVMAAVQQFNQQAGYAPVQIVQPPAKPPQPRMCYDPGTPSTPDTVIPGHPGTPDTVIPGVNGMPDTVIPGIPETPDRTIPGSGSPGTPGGWHECP
jgi:type IV secretion system protein VirB10